VKLVAQEESHGDGVVGVTGDVPTGIVLGVGKERAGAGDVFFRTEGVNLEFHFVAVVRDGKEAEAMHGGSGGAELGDRGAELEPGEIDRIGDEEKSDESGGTACEEAGSGRSWSGIGHKNCEGVLCPGTSRRAR